MAQDFTVDRNSPKWVLGADGYLKEYIADAPAIEFNADGSYKGVLVEPQSVNTQTYSEDFRDTATAGTTRPWLNDNVTVSISGTVYAPDNTLTANRLTQTVFTSDSSTISDGFSLTGGTVYSWSVFVKADQNSRFRLWVVLSNQGFGADFNLVTLTYSDLGLSGGNLNVASIRDYGNGWYRCSVSGTRTNSSTVSARFDILDASGSISYNGDGVSGLYLWGAQLEASPIATSYIPTTTGAVTRLKDDIYLTSASSLIGQTEGTLFVEVDWQLTSGTTQILLGATDASFNNGFRIYNDSSPVNLIMRARAGGVDLTVQGEASTAYTGIQKIAFAYAENDFELYRNGSSISSDTSGSLSALATVTDIDFGQSATSASQANMWIRAVALFTTRLSDAEVYSLTGYDTYAQMANALQYTIL